MTMGGDRVGEVQGRFDWTLQDVTTLPVPCSIGEGHSFRLPSSLEMIMLCPHIVLLSYHLSLFFTFMLFPTLFSGYSSVHFCTGVDGLVLLVLSCPVRAKAYILGFVARPSSRKKADCTLLTAHIKAPGDNGSV